MDPDLPPPDAARVWALMQAFVDRHSPRHRLRAELGDTLGKGRGRVMTLLDLTEGPRSLGEIAQARGVDPPYATEIVDRLEALGLAERTPDPADRRRRLVVLTAEGHRLAERVRIVVGTPPEPLLELSRDELGELERFLRRLAP